MLHHLLRPVLSVRPCTVVLSCLHTRLLILASARFFLCISHLHLINQSLFICGALAGRDKRKRGEERWGEVSVEEGKQKRENRKAKDRKDTRPMRCRAAGRCGSILPLTTILTIRYETFSPTLINVATHSQFINTSIIWGGAGWDRELFCWFAHSSAPLQRQDNTAACSHVVCSSQSFLVSAKHPDCYEPHWY